MGGATRVAATVLAVLTVTACGRFDRVSDDGSTARSPSLIDPSPDADANLLHPPATATTSAPPSLDPAMPTEAAAAGPGVAGSGAGVRSAHGAVVTVIPGGGPRFGSWPAFDIEVTLRNDGDRPLWFWLGQGNFATLADAAGQVRWASTSCDPTAAVPEIYGGVEAMSPGASRRVIVRYPQPDLSEDLGCQLEDGVWELRGQWPICPEAAVEETENPGTFRCDEADVVMVASAPVVVFFGQPS